MKKIFIIKKKTSNDTFFGIYGLSGLCLREQMSQLKLEYEKNAENSYWKHPELWSET